MRSSFKEGDYVWLSKYVLGEVCIGQIKAVYGRADAYLVAPFNGHKYKFWTGARLLRHTTKEEAREWILERELQK